MLPFTLVVGTDSKNEALLSPFFASLKDKWPQLGCPIIINASLTNIPNGDIKCIRHAPNASWSSRMIKALKLVKTKIILLMLDDFFLVRPVDTGFVEEAVDLFNHPEIKCVRLDDYPAISNYCNREISKRFMVLDKCAEYPCSAQAAFWDTSYLTRLLRRGENAWQFEDLGSERQRKMKKGGLIAFRKEEFSDSFNYLLGKAIVRGRFNASEETLFLAKRFPELKQFTTERPTKKHSRLTIWLCRKWGGVYRRLHVHCRWLPMWNLT